jgi:hypothetical protein
MSTQPERSLDTTEEQRSSASNSTQLLGGDAKQERQIQCTRCRHKHCESERGRTKPDSYGMTTSICPRCRGQSYYQLGDDGKPERMAR